MTKTITFNELRRIKDSLPDGATQRIADELGLKVETVRNYFGGANYENGPDGGIVEIDDTTILEKALALIGEMEDPSEPEKEEA